MTSCRTTQRTDIQSCDAWFASLTDDRDSVYDEDTYGQAFWLELAIATTGRFAVMPGENVKPNAARQSQPRGLKERSPKFGV